MEHNCIFYCYRKTRELNSQKIKKPGKIELVAFDMDGVLTDIISSWKYIHDYYKTSNNRSVNDYLKGEIDDMEFIRRDAILWVENGKPVKKDKLVEILSDVPLMKGAEDCIAALKSYGMKTAIVSAGLDVLADKVGKELGVDYIYSNGVEADENGHLNGVAILGVKLMYKDEVIISLSEKLNIPLEQIVTVGNSCYDIPMFEVSGLGIAFNPSDKCTRDAADIVVEGKDVSKILYALKNYIN